MAKCAALDCSFLNQYENYLLQHRNYSHSGDTWNTTSPAFPPPPPVLADPDIAGLGVILAFLISAYTTWTVVAIGYVCGYVDKSLLGNVDRRLIRIKPRQSDRWRTLLVKIVIMLSDQQIVTGISVLTATYAKRCTINVYHWQVVVYLAWMSSGTHLITLSVLREQLREKCILRVSRVIGMLILFVMLSIAIAPTASETYYNIISGTLDSSGNVWHGHASKHYSASGVPLACFWSRKYWNGWRWDSGLTYFLLISSYVARAAALFESSEIYFRRNIRDRLLGKLEKALDLKVNHIRDLVAHRRRASWTQKLCYLAYLATYAVTLACLELYSSFLAPLLWVLLNLIWGSLQLFIPRTALANFGAIVQENHFAFGQIIPLMLLALPLVAAFESYYEVSKPIDNHQTPPNSPQRVDSRVAQALPTIDLSLMIQSSHRQMTHEEHDDTAGDDSDQHLVKTDNEQRLGDNHTSAGHLTPHNLCLPRSDLPTGRNSDDSSTSELSSTWRAYHQDFYASMWFRGVQIFVIIYIILVAFVLCLYISPILDIDLFASPPNLSSTLDSILIFLSWVFLLLCIVVGGMFKSKVFR